MPIHFKPHQLDNAQLAKGLAAPNTRRIFLGFDAFTDVICAPVEKRIDANRFTRFAGLGEFGKAVADAAGNSANFELMVLETRIGGNAANLARVLCTWKHRVHLAANVGTQKAIEPLFTPLTKACAEVFPLGPSAHTDALEFNDGKLLLGKMGTLLQLSTESIFALMGSDTITRQLDACDLFASVNWTMLANAPTLWAQLRAVSFGRLCKKRRVFLVDLADPRKRSRADLQNALSELANWREHFEVVLSLNPSESAQVSAALHLKSDLAQTPEKRQRQCRSICQALRIAAVAVHATDFATVGTLDQSCSVETPFCATPATTTGGGDHFNAGLCQGLLKQLNWPEILAMANATSGCFVRSAKSPTLVDLKGFFDQWLHSSHPR